MGFGTFDGIHAGHMSYLRQLKMLGYEIIVVVARDRNVKKIKGKKPRIDEKERLKAIEQTELVDKVLMGHTKNFYYWINKFQPDVIGLGYDQKANVDELKEQFPKMEIVRLKAYKPEKFKTSIINGVKK